MNKLVYDKIDEVLPNADFLYLAVPETEETKGLINKTRLDSLKSTCGIVNIGRQSILDYEALRIKLEKNEIGFLIFRIASTPRGKVLRILEIITTASNINLASAIQKLLDDYDCQYADYFTNIVNSEIADEYGLLTVDSSMNLPNLFEPLSKIKSRIYFAIKLKKNDTIQISRGDCDQDRPNILG